MNILHKLFFKKYIMFTFFIVCILSLSVSFFDAQTMDIFSVETTSQFSYSTDIKNIFIHSLIAYPEILDKKPKTVINTYHSDCIDYVEFENMLTELYKNNYVLIDVNKTFVVDENGNAKKCAVKVPVGKKPLVLGVDDVVYDPKKSGNGMVDKLCLDEKGEICSETNIDGKIDRSYNREFVPILENFLQKHPDFSPFGDRCTINLTGFCGILGYRITDKNIEFRQKEIEEVLPLVSKLKQLGYTFACHSYSHLHIKKTNVDEIEKDLQNWKEKIEPIIGKTNVFVYPYGEWELANGNELSKKQKLLCQYGFKLFLGVGIYDFFEYMPLNKNIKAKVLFADRKNIDGFSLLKRTKELSSIFDANIILSDWAKKRQQKIEV